MRSKLLFTILATTMLIATSLHSAEVIPIWFSKWDEENSQPVHDFEFLKGEEQFILIGGLREKGAIQIRETLTGELITSIPLSTANYFNQIEITPDSNRFVITTDADQIYTAAIELRNISDFKIIKKLVIKMDADSVDSNNQPYYYIFKDIVIDPIKPYLYAFITKTNLFNDEDADRTWLRVYNYETMEEIKDLTPKGFEYEQMKCMDISDDGRFLAVLNEGKSFLKIWDTEKFDLITNKQLYDNSFNEPKDYWCKAGDIEFSHIDNDLIYISGGFPNMKKQQNPDFNPYGLYKYNKSTDNFYKEYLGPNPYRLFTLFDNEERVLLAGDFVVLNQKSNKQELYINSDIKHPTSGGNLYSYKNNFFLGKAGGLLAGFRYDSQTSIESDYEDEIIISPNPTNSSVNINLNCMQAKIDYQIYDINGISIFKSSIENQNILQIDFTNYPSGVYFITINCNVPKTYKIIKEG